MSLLKRYLPRAEVTPFVIVCLPRTGSNLLGEMLDTHPEVLCHMEIFNPKSTYLSRKPHLRIGTKEERDRDPWTFLRRVYEVTDGRRVVGLKLMPNHNNPVLLSLLLNRKVRKIVLHRPNVLQTYVSTCIALQTQQWQLRANDSDGGQRRSIKVDIDVRAFKRYARKVRIFYAIVRTIEVLTAQRFYHVNYPQLAQDRVIATELMQFLGINPNVQLQKPLAKQNASSLQQKVGNYDELKRELSRDAQFAALLDPET
jgi:LPS sulfotransferase NodH